MKKQKRARLEAQGWRVGDTTEFLNLSEEEAALIELKADLGAAIRERRKASRMTQSSLAKKLGSSQSRIAKMESGDPSVSLDLQLRSLFALGFKRKQVAKAVWPRRAKVAV
jgi:ribosome-binding protein aMBF1 (putative translation factor)